ncbi:hypothetical protein RB598_009176 [Gaeumannomyces tritici]
MKVKALSRAPQQPAGSDVARKPKNVDPALHPFERAREYQRALNAVKLERMFAAPFICQLGKGHVDSVFSMTMDPGSLSRVASGSADGVVKIWDLTSREEAWHTTAHENIVKDLCFTKDKKLLTCAADRTIKLFSPEQAPNSAPLSTWLGTNAFTSLSHHRSRNSFAASSSVISVYDLERHSAAPEVLRWPTSTDTINSVAFNQVEQSILGSCASDRGIVLYDLRTSMPLHKTVLNFTSNKIAWNPTEAFNFAVASEDHNIYIFDMRKIDRALNVLKGHVAAVMDVQFSPNGEELVSGSYDRTIRLWKKDKGHSVDIYHSKSARGWVQSGVRAYVRGGRLTQIADMQPRECREFFPPHGLRTTNTCSAAPTTAISASGEPRPRGGKVSSRQDSDRRRNTTRHSARGSPTCPRSDASRTTATFPRWSRRQPRSRTRSSRRSSGGRRTSGSTQKRSSKSGRPREKR